ncbi:MAG: hypothetical protein ABI905_15735 [Betaproteobacteria bacterium]
MKIYLAIVFSCLVNAALAETSADLVHARAITANALKARAANKPAEYLSLMQEAFPFRPNMPGMMLRLSGAHAASLAGMAGTPVAEVNREKSLALLEQIARTGLYFNIAADPDFAGLKDEPRFRAVVDAMAINAQPFVKSVPAFELAEKDFLPEGIAYDEGTRSFFIASVHMRKIVKRLWTGQVKPFSMPADGLWSVVAIAIDPQRRVLWAASAAMDQSKDIDEKDIGRTAIFKYDLDREKLVARIELPRSAARRTFGDLLVAPNGDVYISESQEGGIYRVVGDRLESFVPPGSFASPQGMVLLDKNKWLYVADFSLGLMRVDMQTKVVEWLPPPPDGTLLGLDALARHGKKLIATQNGIRPHRVVEISLDAQGQVARVVRLESSHPKYNEPTLGVVVGNDFYYVANAQWDLFERGKTAPLDQLAVPLILRLPLGEKK